MSDYDHEYTGTLPVLPVADVSAGLEYFVEKLGFSEVFAQEDQAIVVNAQVQLDGCHVMLNLNPNDADKEGGGIYLWIRARSRDINDLYQWHLQNGVRMEEDISDQFWGDRSYVCKLPHGFRIAFTQRQDLFA